MAKIEIVIKDKKDEVKFTKALMFLVDILNMKDRVKIEIKDVLTNELLDKVLSSIPYVTVEEQKEWEKILEESNPDAEVGLVKEIEI